VIHVSSVTERKPVGDAMTVTVEFVVTEGGDRGRLYAALREAGDKHGWVGIDAPPFTYSVGSKTIIYGLPRTSIPKSGE